ncbi:MAG: hypothetical protein ABI861_12550 [Panacibacter sp.]
MSVPTIPQEYTHHLLPDKQFDIEMGGKLESDFSGGFDARHSGSLQTIVSGKLETENVLTLKGDSKEPVATDSKIEILNLPRFTLQDIKDMMKVRVHVPNYSNVCFKVFGVEMFSLCMSGEAQVITEPYIPNAAERCEDNCCEPDTRPFPETREG